MSETPPEPVATDPVPPVPGPPAPVPPPVPQPAPGQEPPASPGFGEELPPWAQKQLKALRDEAASHRVKANEATAAAAAEVAKLRADQEAQRIAMGKALGLVADEPPTAEQLAKQLADSQAAIATERSRAQQAAVELAVLRASGTLGADGNALLDSNSFTRTLTGLDPAAPDFAQKVTEAITATVEAQPKFKVAAAAAAPPALPAVPKSGTGPVTGVPDGPRQLTEADIDRMSPSEVQKAMDAGLLQNLGFGTARKKRR